MGVRFGVDPWCWGLPRAMSPSYHPWNYFWRIPTHAITIHQRYRRTDGLTDWRTTYHGNTALRYASRGKNWQKADQDWIRGNFSSVKEWSMEGMGSRQKSIVNTESVNSFKNAISVKIWKRYKLISCQSINLQVQVQVQVQVFKLPYIWNGARYGSSCYRPLIVICIMRFRL